MQTTKQVLSALRRANPERRVTEDLIRSAIRREVVAAPQLVAGRFLWTPDDVARLADALALWRPAANGGETRCEPAGNPGSNERAEARL